MARLGEEAGGSESAQLRSSAQNEIHRREVEHREYETSEGWAYRELTATQIALGVAGDLTRHFGGVATLHT